MEHSASIPAPARSPRRRVIALFIAAALVAGVGYAAYSVRRAYLYTFEAEERLQVSFRVTDAIIQHIRSSPTHTWPTSWDDLLRQPRVQEMLAWPGGLERAKTLVHVDFTTTVDDVLKQTPETCTAVTVTPGPNYPGIPARWLYGLYDELTETKASNANPPPPPARTDSGSGS